MFSCPSCRQPLPLKELIRKRGVVRECAFCKGKYRASKSPVWLPVGLLLVFWAFERDTRSAAAWFILFMLFMLVAALADMALLKVREVSDEDRRTGRLR